MEEASLQSSILNLPVCVCACLCATLSCVQMQRPEKGVFALLELELVTRGTESLTWVLGAELRILGRTV